MAVKYPGGMFPKLTKKLILTSSMTYFLYLLKFSGADTILHNNKRYFQHASTKKVIKKDRDLNNLSKILRLWRSRDSLLRWKWRPPFYLYLIAYNSKILFPSLQDIKCHTRICGWQSIIKGIFHHISRKNLSDNENFQIIIISEVHRVFSEIFKHKYQS